MNWTIYEDKPIDWLNSARGFANALGYLLKENEGVIVELCEDLEISNLNFGKSIVYNSGKQIHIMKCPEECIHEKCGTLIWLD